MGRPKLYSDEELRDKRRLKQAKWRTENLERAREIVRQSMKRANDAKASAEGRVPGKKGRPAIYTEEQKRERRREKAAKYYRNHAAKLSARTAELQRLTRAGLYEPKPFKKLTHEERKRQLIADQNKRRSRVRDAGGEHTPNDIVKLREQQKGKCAFCLKKLGAEVHVDHYMPLALGGTNDRGNLRLLHAGCNLAKGAKHPVEHARENGLLCW